jgi:hypothetical protein
MTRLAETLRSISKNVSAFFWVKPMVNNGKQSFMAGGAQAAMVSVLGQGGLDS